MTHSKSLFFTLALGLICFVTSAMADFEAPSAPVAAPDPLRGISPVSVTLRFEIGRDDNVQIVPDATPFFGNGPTEANYAAFTATIDTVLALGGVPIETSLNLGFHQSGSSDGGSNDADVYDFTQYSLTLATPIAAGDGKTRLRPYLKFGGEDNSEGLEAIGANSFEFGSTLSYQASSTLSFSGIARVAMIDFDVDFPGIDTRNRDSTFMELGGDVSISSANRRTKGSFGFRLQRNNAEGSDWDYSAVALSAGVVHGFGNGFFGNLDVTHTRRDYDGGFTDLVPAGRSEEYQTSVDLGLLYILDAKRSFDIGVSRTTISANDPAFEGDRTQFRAGFTMVLP